MTVQQRDKRVEKAQTGVIFKVPFFACGVAKLPVVWDASIPTACTAGDNIRFNPGFFDSLTDSQVCTVLCHETAHCLLGHVWRGPPECTGDPRLWSPEQIQAWDTWNQAADHAVNLLLKEFSGVVMAKGLADPFPFPEPADAFCADPAFKGLAEEVIYRRLASSKPPGSQKPGGGQGGGKAGASGKPPPGSMPSFGQIAMPDPGVPSSSKKLQSDWASTLIQSAKLAQGQGTLPGALERLVGELVNPRVPWQELLRSWLREQCADDYDFMAPAVEYVDSGFILPSLRSERMAPVVFGWDRSGSVDAALDAQMASEAQSCLDNMRPRKLIVMPFDTRVTAVREYAPGETIDTKSEGGGGTDFRDLFQKCGEMAEAPRCIVVLTDLWGTFPDHDPGIATIWVSWTKDKQAPFGVTVYAGE